MISPCSLSFYKETLVGDTGNYIHMRATAERRPPLTVLEELIEENLDSARKIKKFAASQTGLTEICHSSLMVRQRPFGETYHS